MLHSINIQDPKEHLPRNAEVESCEPMHSDMAKIGGSCAMCRKKSRRCDRARPICGRCTERGLECGGYPEKFRFCGLASRGKWKNRDAPTEDLTTPSADVLWPQGKRQVKSESPRSKRQTQVDRHIAARTKEGLQVNQAQGGVQSPPSLVSNEKLEINNILASERAQTLLSHYDRVICPHQIAQRIDSIDNPYRSYVLPLAFEHICLLYAVLGLSACHLGHLKTDSNLHETVAVNYRVKAFTALGTYIEKASCGTFDQNQRDGVFATIQILLLHDICESGISIHGAHISGAMSICSQLMLEQRLSADQERTVFFLGNLAWLDIIRAFSGPERLYLTQDVRQRLLSLGDLKFEAVNGCPRELVLIIGAALEGAKLQARGQLGMEQYLATLRDSIRKLYLWDSSNCTYPDDNSLWLSVAECFRHACVLRALRLLNITESAEERRIQNSVTAILNAVSTIPGNSPLIELMVLPLFMAGADCLSPHSRHYILLRLAEIKARSEMNNMVPKQLLERVWEERARQPKHNRKNVPWMDFTYDDELNHQHDFLII